MLQFVFLTYKGNQSFQRLWVDALSTFNEIVLL
jgi:hypothetical protein